MAEKDRIAIARKACLLAGVTPITSFSGARAEEIFCAEMYEELVESELSLYKWRFATDAVLIDPLAASPVDQFDSAHQLPDAVLYVDTVLEADEPIIYERQGRLILSNGYSETQLVCRYRYRADETSWPPYFRLLIISRLAAALSYSIARRSEVAVSMNEAGDLHWRRAKTADAQGQTNKRLKLTGLKNRRRGGVDKFWRNR